MSYAEAMDRFGTDRPDTRFGLELVDITDLMAASEVRVFRQAIERGGLVKVLRLPDGNHLSRKELDDLIEFVKIFGAQDGLDQDPARWLAVAHCQIPLRRPPRPPGRATPPGRQRSHLLYGGPGQNRPRGLGKSESSTQPAAWLDPPDRYNFVWVTEFPWWNGITTKSATPRCIIPSPPPRRGRGAPCRRTRKGPQPGV